MPKDQLSSGYNMSPGSKKNRRESSTSEIGPKVGNMSRAAEEIRTLVDQAGINDIKLALKIKQKLTDIVTESMEIAKC